MRWMIIVVCVLGLALTACTRPQAAEAEVEASEPEVPVIAVEVTPAVRGVFVGQIEVSGVVSGVREAGVVSETRGIIEAVAFDLGQRVSRGQVLVRLDDAVERFAMQQAESQYEVAQLELESTTQLFEAERSSMAAMARARAMADGTRSALESARKRHRDRIIRAPIGGLVAARGPAISFGEFLTEGVQVARIVDISSLEMDVAIGEAEVLYVNPGAEAGVLISACGDEIQNASVRAVAAGSDPRSGSYPVVLEWENQCGSRIKSGMSAVARIAPTGEAPVIIAPSIGLLRREGVDIVYVARNEQAEARVVRIGRQFANRSEILEGVNEGELIVVSALSALSDGTPLRTTIVEGIQ